MNEQEALNVLIQGVMIGQQHGVYSLRDSSILFQAINVLKPDYDGEGQQVPQQPAPQNPLQTEINQEPTV